MRTMHMHEHAKWEDVSKLSCTRVQFCTRPSKQFCGAPEHNVVEKKPPKLHDGSTKFARSVRVVQIFVA